MTPVRLQLSRRKGFDLQAWSREVNGLPAVNVARPGPFGNPFTVEKHGRAYAVDLFRRLTSGFLCLTSSDASVEDQKLVMRRVADGLDDLRGKNLACWCRLDGGPCHADVLLALANAPAPGQDEEGR